MSSEPVGAVGEQVPDFVLPDSNGTPWRLSERTAARPQVLIFYRGHW